MCFVNWCYTRMCFRHCMCFKNWFCMCFRNWYYVCCVFQKLVLYVFFQKLVLCVLCQKLVPCVCFRKWYICVCFDTGIVRASQKLMLYHVLSEKPVLLLLLWKRTFYRRNYHGHHGWKRRELAQYAHSRRSHAFNNTLTSTQLQPRGEKR